MRMRRRYRSIRRGRGRRSFRRGRRRVVRAWRAGRRF